MATPLCKDCRFHKADPIGKNGEFDKCMRPVGKSRVTGNPQVHRWNHCDQLRNEPRFSLFGLMFKMCARHGRYFQSK